MRKTAVFLWLIFGWQPVLWADVVLPESGRLAGPLDSVRSELGDQFFYFPEFMGQPPPPGGALLSGWVEFQFGVPEGDAVDFTVSYHGVGTPDQIEWGGGQRYVLDYNQAFPQPPMVAATTGTLNLVTGEVTNVVFPAIFRNSTIALVDKLNRIPYAFPPLFPPELPVIPGVELPEFPPGFIFTELSFAYDSEGRITGSEFLGQTILPTGIAAAFNDLLGLFPPFSFGPNGEFYFANPASCTPETPPENCPTNEDNPDGIALPFEALFHPHFFLVSDQLREVPVERVVPPCEPMALAPGATLAAAGGKLYHLGGLDGNRVTGEVQVYDPATNLWADGPSLPRPVVEAQAAAIGTKIYVVGGRRSLHGPATGWLQVLDAETGEWAELESAPFPVAGGAAAAVGDWLYVLGGMTNRPNGSPAGNLRFTDYVQGYDPLTNSWTPLPARYGDEPIRVTGNAAVAVGTDVYLINGRTMDDEVTNEVWIYDTLVHMFTPGPATEFGVYEAAAGRIDGQIYLTGGRSAIDGPAERRGQILVIDRNTWVPGFPQPFPTAASGSAVMSGQFYVAGGRAQAARDEFPGALTRAVQTFDPSAGWQACPSQPLFNAADVLNTASLTVGPNDLSPGSLATLNGLNLAAGMALAPFAEPLVPETLAGVSITVDGLPAPILAVAPDRVDFQIPYGVATGGKVEVAFQSADLPQQAPAVEIPMAETSPGLFVQTCGETRNVDFLHESSVLACNGDGTYNYAANAVRPGEVVSLQMTGLGPITPPLGNGERAPLNMAVVAELDAMVTIRGSAGEPLEATVLEVALVPGTVGLFNVAVQVPADSFVANRVAVEVSSGGVTSNRAMLAVGEPTARAPLACMLYFEPAVSFCLPGVLLGGGG